MITVGRGNPRFRVWKRLFIRNTFRWKLQPKGVLIRTYNSLRFLFLLLFLGLVLLLVFFFFIYFLKYQTKAISSISPGSAALASPSAPVLQRLEAPGRDSLSARCGENRFRSRPKTIIKRLGQCSQPFWSGYPLRFISGQKPESVPPFPS